jgi:uncharacterized protein (TIGR02246 family)
MSAAVAVSRASGQKRWAAVNRPSMKVELEKQKVQQVIEAWLRASKTNDTEALSRLMAEDVVFLVPGQEPMRGRSAFLAAARSPNRKFRFVEGTPKIQEIHIAGNFAICWNHLDVTLASQPDGKLHRHAGHILSVFRKEPDGSWVLFRDANLLTPQKDG